MAKITIFGQGNMGRAIGGLFSEGDNTVSYLVSDSPHDQLGEIIVLAVPYTAIAHILSDYKDEFKGKIIVDLTNPVDFTTFDELVVPADSSAAALIAEQVPEADVIKAFNTNFAATLSSKKVANNLKTTVLMAGDSAEAKHKLFDTLKTSGIEMMDAGNLKRARELEAMGFLQISLTNSEKISWNGGFGLFK